LFVRTPLGRTQACRSLPQQKEASCSTPWLLGRTETIGHSPERHVNGLCYAGRRRYPAISPPRTLHLVPAAPRNAAPRCALVTEDSKGPSSPVVAPRSTSLKPSFCLCLLRDVIVGCRRTECRRIVRPKGSGLSGATCRGSESTSNEAH
jgi:hypothetical protein